MSVIMYNWKNEEHFPIRICITDNLLPLLPHSHDELEIMYFYNTNGLSYFCSEKNIPVLANELIVVNPREIHSCPAWGKNCKAACVLINTKRLLLPIKQVYENKISNKKITDEFYNLKDILLQSRFKQTEKEYKIASVIYSILSHMSNYTKPTFSERFHRKETDEILKFIDENICEKLSLDILAKRVHLSKDRFYHIFKEQTGMSPINYILNARIKKACELLEDSEMTIQKIAAECGFCTPSYFSKKFFQTMHMTPCEYKKNGCFFI